MATLILRHLRHNKIAVDKPLRALLGLLLLAFLAGCQLAPPRPRRIVLITIDTLRFDAVSEQEMPSLFRWSRGATTFTRHYSSTSTTQPTHASLFTGQHPWEHGVVSHGLSLAEGLISLPEQLRAAGFTTRAVVASFPLSARFGFARGFEVYVEEFDRGPRPSPEGIILEDSETYTLADRVTETALAILSDPTFNGSGRQFLWLHYFDPHEPYGDGGAEDFLREREIWQAVSEGRDVSGLLRRARSLYRLDVGFLDLQLARLLARLDEDSEQVDTHTVITADHGEAFGEEGAFTHGRGLTPEQIHVPLIIKSGGFRAGVTHEVSGTVDLHATLLSLAGVRSSPSAGRDLAERHVGQVETVGMRRTFDEPLTLHWMDGTPHTIDYNLFYWIDGEGRSCRGNGRWLFDQREVVDPEQMPECQTALDRFKIFEAQLGTLSPVEDELSRESQEAFRALGYLQ